ncbi:MAG: hypothetical protein WBD00_03745 [Candidatus Omnitrophota bacterium]
MKKIFALAIVLTIVLGSVSAYAEGDSSSKKSTSSGEKESVFQVWADWIKGE